MKLLARSIAFEVEEVEEVPSRSEDYYFFVVHYVFELVGHIDHCRTVVVEVEEVKEVKEDRWLFLMDQKESMCVDCS
jgi:hypothetical protein